jgi:very-short-patch-repair endonuclease
MRLSRTRIQVLNERAAQMRHEPTASEAKLFEAIRGGKLGVAFRRQVPLAGRFIADFYAAEVRLVVEVDGGYHAQRSDADARRDRVLAKLGYYVLRIDGELVMRDLPAVVERVRDKIEALRSRQTPA